MISKDKTYRTVSGKEVRIYCTDAGGCFPVHGAMYNSEMLVWYPSCWNEKGKSSHIGNLDDLVEVKRKIKRKIFLNVYDDDHVYINFSKKEADENADFYKNKDARFACKEIEFEVEEGEGL